MPRFAANLKWLFTEHPFLDRFAAARKAGFQAVEFQSPYEYPPEVVAEKLRENALECILINLPSGDMKRDFGIACRPERVDEFRAGVARALEYAPQLGFPRINCISGVAREGDDRQALRETLLSNVRFAAREFKAAGIELVIEPINDRDVPGFLVPRQEDGAAIIAEADCDNFALQFDLYHCAMMGDDAAALLTRLAPIIRHVQFADAPGRGEPGTGKVPLAQQFAALDRLGYRGWVSAEYRPSKRTEETLHWLPKTA